MKLSALLTDHCVLQRQATVPVWGTTTPQTRLVATLAGQTVEGISGDDGQFLLRFAPMQAGGPHTLEVATKEGDRRVTVADILIGDVWLASGQSNMEWTLRQCEDTETIAQATADDIRMITVPQRADLAPVDTVDGKWELASPETAGHFSAVAFHFGQRLQKETGVPVGIINSSWGGTIIETWISRETLLSIPSQVARVQQYEFDAHLPESWENIAPTFPKDPGNEGLAKGFANPDFCDSAWETMDAPTLWQEYEHQYSGVCWFRKTISLPESAIGKDATLCFGGINKQDTTYVNGVEVGSTGEEFDNLWNVARNYRVPAELTASGELTIAVRVYSFVWNGGLMGKRADMKLLLADGSEISTAGEWRFGVEHNFGFIDTGSGDKHGQANSPYMLYENMIKPLLPAEIKGVIWYQGESNADVKATQYGQLIEALIRDWRHGFGNPIMPFIQVQLANNQAAAEFQDHSDWAIVRNQQLQAATNTNNGIAVIIDAGEAEDIHPKDKLTVGHRLAQWALANTYGQTVVEGSPIMTRYATEPGAIRAFFKNAGDGLKTRDGKPVQCVYIAGRNGEFQAAKTVLLEGDHLVASHPDIPAPTAVRYAWSNNPDSANLVNSINFPASPFATDL